MNKLKKYNLLRNMIENAPNIDIFMKYLLELHYIFLQCNSLSKQINVWSLIFNLLATLTLKNDIFFNTII